MDKNRFKEKNMSMPLEKHNTAAWANIKRTKPVSGVMEPVDFQVSNAKDYVDENEK